MRERERGVKEEKQKISLRKISCVPMTQQEREKERERERERESQRQSVVERHFENVHA